MVKLRAVNTVGPVTARRAPISDAIVEKKRRTHGKETRIIG